MTALVEFTSAPLAYHKVRRALAYEHVLGGVSVGTYLLCMHEP